MKESLSKSTLEKHYFKEIFFQKSSINFRASNNRLVARRVIIAKTYCEQFELVINLITIIDINLNHRHYRFEALFSIN